MSSLPKGRVLNVSLQVTLPETASTEDVLDWLRMEFENEGGVSAKNPLYAHAPEARLAKVRDTGCFMAYGVFDVERRSNGSTSDSEAARLLPDDRDPKEVEAWAPRERIRGRALGAALEARDDGPEVS
jgi:hypothetical protein